MELELFLNVITHGPGPQQCGPAVRSGPRWTESSADRRRGGALSARSVLGIVGSGSSPTVAREDEEDEAVPRGCSPEHGQRRRGDAMEACSRVGCSPFIGARERQGGGGQAAMVGVMALSTVDGRAGLRGC
jgi:hypothetical protein